MKTICVLAFAFSLLSQVYTQTKNEEIISPYFVAIVVTNIDSSIKWYSDILGLQVRNRTDDPQRGFKQVNLTNERILIELVELKSMIQSTEALKDSPRGTKVVGFYKYGFVVSDFDKIISYLKDKGAQFKGDAFTDQISGKRSVQVYDLDKNTLQFFER